MIPTQKQEYLNKEIYKIVDLVKTSESSPTQKVEYVYPNGDVEDWSDKFINLGISQEKDINGNVITVKIYDEHICRELDEHGYKSFLKFIQNLYKDSNINSKVSLDFIKDQTLEYIITVHKCASSQNYCDYIMDSINNSLGQFKVYLPVLNLSVYIPFKIGLIEFTTLNRDFFERHKKEDDINSSNLFEKKYRGQLFASYTVECEKEKAKEIALRECSLALDVLKICSDTLDFPLYKISFDIDSRITENLNSELIIDNLLRKEDMSISMYRIPNYHEIGYNEWKRIENRSLYIFDNFLNELNIEHSELEKLIVNSIKRFSKALTTTNLHQRIVEIFTILESLLVLDSNSAILDNLTKYSSKLVTKNLEFRLSIIDLIKKMYIIRSQYVHHAQEKDFEIENLQNLQFILHKLLIILISLKSRHSNKKSILKEIDDAILRAY